jgi:hypothetical protein
MNYQAQQQRRFERYKKARDRRYAKYGLSREEIWINSEEGRYMKTHCPRQYYDTLQEIRES